MLGPDGGLVGTRLALSPVVAGVHHAAVVIVYDNGKRVEHCVSFSESEISGLELLERTEINILVDTSNAMGVAVCKIGKDGCNYPNKPCFCQCQGASCVYWSYWHWTGSDWQYSNMGASGSAIHDGAIDGWVWGIGTVAGAQPPPPVSFDAICSMPAATPRATSPPPSKTPHPPTATNEPTNTLVPATNTNAPTETAPPPSETISAVAETTSEIPPTEAAESPTDVPTDTSLSDADEPTAVPNTTDSPPVETAMAEEIVPTVTQAARARATTARTTPTRVALAPKATAHPTRAVAAPAPPPDSSTIDTQVLAAAIATGGIILGGCGFLLLGGGILWFVLRKR